MSSKRTVKITWAARVGPAKLKSREITTQVTTKRELAQMVKRTYGTAAVLSVEIINGPGWPET